MTKEKLKDNFDKLANDYLSFFCKKHNVVEEGRWLHKTGGMANIADMIISYDAIIIAVDNEIEFSTIYEWFYFTLENYKEHKGNKYFELLPYAEELGFQKLKKGFGFYLKEFHKQLLK